MAEAIASKLGELIFNGNVLFLSISFGIFTFSLGNNKVTISNIYGFGIFTILLLIASILSMVLSFYGIKNNDLNLIYGAGICLILVIILLTVTYSQIYLNIVSNSNVITVVPPQLNVK